MKLVIGYDGSDGAKAAIDDLSHAYLPDPVDATVLSVIDGRALAKAENRGATAEADRAGPGTVAVCNAVARAGAERLSARFPRWKVSAEVSVGAPAWKIIERAEEESADLLIVGSRGFGELKRLLFGSVAHHVVTQSRCPVRLGRPPRHPDPVADRPLRIIVGDDGSPDARAAVNSVAARRWPLGTRILVATFETGVLTGLYNWAPNTIWGGDPTIPDSTTVIERPAIGVATHAANALRVSCPGVSVTTLVQPGDPKYALIQVAETWEEVGADCVFVGATGVRGIARFLVGSVSTTVALNAPCSVEVIHRR